MKSKVVIVIVALLLVSCSATQVRDISRVDYSALKVGEASQEETIELLGKPAYIDKNPDGRSVYMYDTATNEISGFMFNEAGILTKIVVYRK
jgi:6-phosphogluconolactonase (cycloisomerase 2 family)